MTVVVVLLGAVTAVLTLLVVGLLRSHAEILRRLQHLGAGLGLDTTPTPAAASAGQLKSPPEREGSGRAADLIGKGPGTGEALSIQVTGVEHDTVLAFLSSTCTTCQRFWDAFRKPKKLGLPTGTHLVIVTKGVEGENPGTVAGLAPSGVTTVMSTEAYADYNVLGSPYFVQIHGPSGRIQGEGTGTDWEHVQSVLSQADLDEAVPESP